MINHASGDAIWDLIYEIARTGSLAVMPAGCGTLLTFRELLEQLPPGLPEPIVVVASGAEIRQAVEGA